MRVTTMSGCAPPPGTVLEWTAAPTAGAAFAEHPAPPSLNQRFHLASSRRGPDRPAWLAFSFDLTEPLDTRALHLAFEWWIHRHEALRSRFDDTADGLTRSVLAPEDVELHSREAGTFRTTAAMREYLEQRFAEQCRPLGWPPYVLGVVRTESGATVFGAFDHSNVDAHSMAIAVHEIQALHRAARSGAPVELPSVGSFLDACADEQRPAPEPPPDDPAMRSWREFLADCGGTTPSFPLDLGVEAGHPAPQASETLRLLHSAEAEEFEHLCRRRVGNAFSGVLAAFGVALRMMGAERRVRLLIPLHTRHSADRERAVGWFTTNAPVVFDVPSSGFEGALDAASAAFREALATLRVPFPRVLAALAGEFRQVRDDVFMMSYLDYRDFPLYQDFPDCDPHHISSEGRADDAQFWISRTADGLFLRARYPSTAQARETVAGFHSALINVLESVSNSVTASGAR